MLHLTFAPSTQSLAELAADKLAAIWSDPFNPPTVIVPNPAVEKWLLMRLVTFTKISGCVANLKMLRLERFLWNTLSPDENMTLMDAEHLCQLVCSLLDKPLLQEKIFTSLKNYLCSSQNGSIDPVKRVQLSGVIAQQFREYEYNRPSVWDEKLNRWKMDGIDATWLKGNYYCGGDAHEVWQSELYRRVYGLVENGGSETDNRCISLPHLYRWRREKSRGEMDWCQTKGEIFIFGVSKISHFHRNTLVEISQAENVEMRVFLTNPCAEFWEDVNTSRNRNKRRKWSWNSTSNEAGITPMQSRLYSKENLDDELPPEQGLLRLWGEAGKENVFLWCPQAQWNFEYIHHDSNMTEHRPQTTLESVKESLLLRTATLSEPIRGWGDDSLFILASPDRGREIEEIREQILDMVHRGEVERLNEIVVYLTDPAAYLVHINRVFGACDTADPTYIPYTILGAPGSGSLFAQGMRSMLELIRGRFDRAGVFELLRNPIVQVTSDFTPENVSVWEVWAEKLGIFRGYNREHRKTMGDRGEMVSDAHTFELGIARMLIGNLTSDPVELDYKIVPETFSSQQVSVVVPFTDFDTSDEDLLEKFCAVTEDLFNDIKNFSDCNNGELEIEYAVELIKNLVWRWFGRIDKLEKGGGAEGRVQKDFLESLDIILLQKTTANRENFPIEEFLKMVEACLPDELSSFGNAWVGGVTFAPLRPAMVLSHKVVIVAGLDAALFPGTSEKPGWDLLSGRRIIGDSDRVKDNRFVFLELFHAAQKKLVMSFRCRNMQKDEELQPSSVVLEFEEYLKNAMENNTDKSANVNVVRGIPWVLHESIKEMVSAGRLHGSWDCTEVELGKLAAKYEKNRALHRHELVCRKDGSLFSPAIKKEFHTTYHDLKRFITNPLEYHLYKTLNIDLEEESVTMGVTDEPLDSGNLALGGMQRNIWIRILEMLFPKIRGAENSKKEEFSLKAERVAIQIYDYHAATGGAPEGLLYKNEKRKLTEWAIQCCEKTQQLLELFDNHYLVVNTDFTLGRKGLSGDLTIKLDGEKRCFVECRHSLVLMPRDPAVNREIGILAVKKEGNVTDNHELWLAAVLQQIFNKGNGICDRINLVQLNRDKISVSCEQTLTPESTCDSSDNDDEYHEPAVLDVKCWLKRILTMMLIEKCSQHLPFVAVREITKKRKNDNAHFRERLKRISVESIGERINGNFSSYRCFLEAYKLTDALVAFSEINDKTEQNRKLAQLAAQLYEPVLKRSYYE
ncbi:Exodeoxyribonuclease V gamma chain [Chitinispirillum alkaliphilum]|nr:Exodeoxyribonuclease V gamma chain [Chitinispirillum alkaliphilum]